MSLELIKGVPTPYTAVKDTLVYNGNLELPIEWKSGEAGDWVPFFYDNEMSVLAGQTILFRSRLKTTHVALGVDTPPIVRTLGIFGQVAKLIVEGQIEGVKQVALYFESLLILKTDGSVWVAGRNDKGQLGLGHNDDIVQLTDTGHTAIKIHTNDKTSYLIKADNSLWGTGDNSKGLLGLGDTNDRNIFTQLIDNVDPETFEPLLSGEELYAIRKLDGTLWVTGHNGTGRLGTGNTDDVISFIKVADNVKELIKSSQTAISYFDLDGYLWVTGDNNLGQLGLGDNDDRLDMVNTGLKGIKLLNLSIIKILVKPDNSLWVTGENSKGQLGLGHNDDVNVFTDTGILVKEIMGNNGTIFIVKPDNSLWVTGVNNYGQLGLGDTDDRNVFTDTGVSAKFMLRLNSTSFNSAFVIDVNNELWVTGFNNYGQLGLGDTDDRDTFINTGMVCKSVIVKQATTFIQKLDNTLWSTGYNPVGLLGVNTSEDEVHVFTNTGQLGMCEFKTLLAAFIIKPDGKLLATGYNDFGQLGLGHSNRVQDFTEVTVN